MAVNREQNYNLGGGELYIKFPTESNFRYFGATNEVKLSFSTDKLEHKNSESATLTTDLEVVKEVTAECSFTTEDLNKRVLALAFGGTYNETTQSSGSVTDEEHDGVVGGLVYDLAYKKVSNVVVKYTDDNGDDQTAVENTDYSVDYDFGTIEIAEGGAIDGKDIKVDYDYAEINQVEFSSLDNVSMEVALRFNAKNQVGKPKQTLIHRIILALDGDYELKSSDKLNSLSFKGKVLKDETKPAGKQFVETLQLG
jgi:hypothetical protein